MLFADPIHVDRALAARSLYAFVKMMWVHGPWPKARNGMVDGCHIRVMCEALEDVSAGRVQDLVINVPPGSAKSTISGVLWPLWDWLRYPDRRWIFASFDVTNVRRDSRYLIHIISSPWWIIRFGDRCALLSDRVKVDEWTTIQGGGRFSTGMRGKGTGKHGNILVVDDPVKPLDAFGGTYHNKTSLDTAWETIVSTLSTRTQDPETFARVLIMQRIHEDDPAGHAIAEGWFKVVLPLCYDPAIDCGYKKDPRTVEGQSLGPRWSDRFIKAKQRNPLLWATQYQQQPAPPGGTIIKPEWIDRYTCTLDAARAKLSKGMTIQSWDFAFKGAEESDYVAGGWWLSTQEGKAMHYYLLAAWTDRATMLDSLGQVKARWSKDTPDDADGTPGHWPAGRVVVEDKANGPAIENTLREAMPGVIELVTPKGPKPARLAACTPEFASGQVHMVNGPWLDRIKDTMVKFPNVRRDDEVDQVSQAILYLKEGSAFTIAMNRAKDPETREDVYAALMGLGG